MISVSISSAILLTVILLGISELTVKLAHADECSNSERFIKAKNRSNQNLLSANRILSPWKTSRLKDDLIQFDKELAETSARYNESHNRFLRAQSEVRSLFSKKKPSNEAQKVLIERGKETSALHEELERITQQTHRIEDALTDDYAIEINPDHLAKCFPGLHSYKTTKNILIHPALLTPNRARQ